MYNKICKECRFYKECDNPCAAFIELRKIWKEQNFKDKTTLIRNLRKRMGIRAAEPNRQMRTLADKIIKRFPELHFINDYQIKIGYVMSEEKKKGDKIVYGDCRKVPEVYKAYIPFDFVITFYERNIGLLNENQKKVLMYHELRHIGMGEKRLKIETHDIEDFSNILEGLGIHWSRPGEEIPDILGGDG